METFIAGKKEIILDEFQQRPIQPMPATASGFELAYISKWPYLRLEGEFNVPQKLINYFNANQDLFCVDKISHNSGWSYVAVVGDLDFTFLDAAALSLKSRHVEIKTRPDVLEKWPEFSQLIANLPFDVVSAAVFALQPGTSIAVHTDKYMYGIDKLLIPLNKPKDAFFAFYHHGMVPLQTGNIYAIDASHFHYAVNRSNEIRYHLIIRGCFEKKLSTYFECLKNGFDKYGAPVFEPIPHGDEWMPSNLKRTLENADVGTGPVFKSIS